LKRLLGHDADTGVSEIFHYDALTGDVSIETVQDVSGILDDTSERRNDEQYTKDGIKNEMWHYARVPIVVQMKWLAEYGSKNWPMRPGNEKLLFRLLNSPDWKYLKTTEKIHTGRR
jgi:hypothetical protein